MFPGFAQSPWEEETNRIVAEAQKDLGHQQELVVLAAQRVNGEITRIVAEAREIQGWSQDFTTDVDRAVRRNATPGVDAAKFASDREMLLRHPPGSVEEKILEVLGDKSRRSEAPRELDMRMEGTSWNIRLAKDGPRATSTVFTEKGSGDEAALQETMRVRMRRAESAIWTLRKFWLPRDVYEQIKSAEEDLREVKPDDAQHVLRSLWYLFSVYRRVAYASADVIRRAEIHGSSMSQMVLELSRQQPDVEAAHLRWLRTLRRMIDDLYDKEYVRQAQDVIEIVDHAFGELLRTGLRVRFAKLNAESSRRPLDHKKLLDMLVDETEEKYIELLEGTRSHVANVDNYLERIAVALEDDFNTQFYQPALRELRGTARTWDVQFGQVEHTSVLANNRGFARVAPQATMEFDLPKRDLLITEAMKSAQAAYQQYGALVGDPNFLALTKMYSGQPTSSTFGRNSPNPAVRDVLPGLPSMTDEKYLVQEPTRGQDGASPFESLVPDPAVYKFETGTAFELRPVVQPDGQAVVFHFQYLYTTNVREPVRADEKHLGRVKRHFIDTDVQLGNYELKEVGRYQVALRASRTARGVPLLEDVPVAGALFRPLPNSESSLQENLVLAQATIYPTLFDLMGLRWAPAVADLDALRLQEQDFVARGRQRDLRSRVSDYSSQQVDEFLHVPAPERRGDLYREQYSTPTHHPNGYVGPGLGIQEGQLREGTPEVDRDRDSPFIESVNPEGRPHPSRAVSPPPYDEPAKFLPKPPESGSGQGKLGSKMPSGRSDQPQQQSGPGAARWAPRTAAGANGPSEAAPAARFPGSREPVPVPPPEDSSRPATTFELPAPGPNLGPTSQRVPLRAAPVDAPTAGSDLRPVVSRAVMGTRPGLASGTATVRPSSASSPFSPTPPASARVVRDAALSPAGFESPSPDVPSRPPVPTTANPPSPTRVPPAGTTTAPAAPPSATMPSDPKSGGAPAKGWRFPLLPRRGS